MSRSRFNRATGQVEDIPEPVFVITVAQGCVTKADREKAEKLLGKVVWLEWDPKKEVRPDVEQFRME